MKYRPDLLASDAPPGVEVYQLTTGELPSSHIYMEAQIFHPDSRRFLLHESAHPHGSDKLDPKHRYLVCDLDDDCALRPLTTATGATAPSVSPDGSYVYYFIDQTEPGGGSLTLKRVGLDGSDCVELLTVEAPLPGTDYYPSRLYPLSTIRADGGKIALSCFLGDGHTAGAPWGLMVFDLENPAVELVLVGPSWCNMHPQYSRSSDPDIMRDILVQENHGNQVDTFGQFTKLVGGSGADIHVIRDDGTHFRDMPWGRDGNEFCQGHQCWRGTSTWAITSTGTREPAEQQLIESLPVAASDHLGLTAPGGRRNHLSRCFTQPSFYHFATDIDGRRLISDTGPRDQGGRVFIADFGTAGEDALVNWTCIANPKSSWTKEAHIHPFLSPDGKHGFFNSDESGVLQAYMLSKF